MLTGFTFIVHDRNGKEHDSQWYDISQLECFTRIWRNNYCAYRGENCTECNDPLLPGRCIIFTYDKS